MDAFNALILHGIGQPERGYSDFAQKQLSAACFARGRNLHAREVLYSPVFDKAAERFLKATKAAGSKGNLTQRVSINLLADALQWQGNPRIRTAICNVINDEYLKLRATGTVVIFAHSLGCLAALEWLRTRPAIRRVRLVTMGFNAGLFSLGQRFNVPAQVSQPGRWWNLTYPTDMLGWSAAATPGLGHVSNIMLPAASGFNASALVPGASHVDYFGDERLWGEIIPSQLLPVAPASTSRR